MKRSRLSKESYEMYSEEKRGSRKWSGPKSCAQGEKQIKENPNVKCNKVSGDLRARSCPDNLPNREKELNKS